MTRIIYILFFIPTIVSAQFGPQQVISTEGDGPQSVFAADLDGDTFKDVLSANKFGYNLTWYKNMGDGSFGEQQIIATLNQPKIIFAGDLDGDNDLDVLATALFIDELVWYKNLDGQGTFSTQIIIDNELDGPYDVKAVDIDGDLDLDVVCGTESSGLVWFENLDGLGTFSTKKVINASVSNSRSVMAIDLDGDTDLDIVASSSGSVTVSWYENLDGLGNFGEQQVIAGSTLTVQSIYAADLDGDLDNDIISATTVEDKVSWYENLDGLGNFGAEQIITTQADFVFSVFAADLDNDNDMDVLAAAASDDKVAWYKNLDGEGDFSTEQIITSNADSVRWVIASDLDNDGDMDVLSASQNDDKVAWYENLTILGLEEVLNLKIELYPNPANTLLNITNKENYSIDYIKMSDAQGKLVKHIKGFKTPIAITNLQKGVYFITIQTDQGKLIKKIIKE